MQDIKYIPNSYEDACKALNKKPLTLEDFSPSYPEDKRRYLLSLERVETFVEALKDDDILFVSSQFADTYDLTGTILGLLLSMVSEEHAEHIVKSIPKDITVITKFTKSFFHSQKQI